VRLAEERQGTRRNTDDTDWPEKSLRSGILLPTFPLSEVDARKHAAVGLKKKRRIKSKMKIRKRKRIKSKSKSRTPTAVVIGSYSCSCS
jgi:hypothetical protein